MVELSEREHCSPSNNNDEGVAKKERFVTIWNRHTFTIEAFARKAGVGESIILAMLEDKAVIEEVATHVLDIFSTLTSKPYSMANVEVVIKHEPELAALLAAIDEEIEAAKRGLYGFAEGTSRHAVITAKMETLIGSHLNALKQADSCP